MIFKRISYKIALQFMGFVFLLSLINGSIFLIADLSNARRQTQDRLTRLFHFVNEHGTILTDLPESLPPMIRDQVRVVDPSGQTIYSGSLFNDIPFVKIGGF